MPFYLFAAAAGVPLIAWFLLAGGEEAGGGEGGSDSGIGGVMLRLLPLSTIAMMLAAFGVTGLLLGAVGTDADTTFVGALALAVLGGLLNSVVFKYLRRSDSTAIGDDQLSGSVGRVVLPISADHRGRVAVSASGQQLYLSARVVPGDSGSGLEVGASVVVVEVQNGVATVARLDPELT